VLVLRADLSTAVVAFAVLDVYVLYLLGMAGFLAICGVPRAEIAKWALKQADRQRLTDLIRAARGLPAGDGASGDQNGP
jgi:hypothetical protein